MKAICSVNNINVIDDHEALRRIKRYIRLKDGLIDLDINKEYLIFGVLVRDGFLWLYVRDDESDEYPLPYPIEVFSITDSRLSKYWVFSSPSRKGEYPLLVFKEWADDPDFYEKLVNGDDTSVRCFSKYTELMSVEFYEDEHRV